MARHDPRTLPDRLFQPRCRLVHLVILGIGSNVHWFVRTDAARFTPLRQRIPLKVRIQPYRRPSETHSASNIYQPSPCHIGCSLKRFQKHHTDVATKPNQPSPIDNHPVLPILFNQIYVFNARLQLRMAYAGNACILRFPKLGHLTIGTTLTCEECDCLHAHRRVHVFQHTK